VIQVADMQAAQTAPPEWVRDELGGATGRGIRVAVLDSGWDRSIDDPRVLPGVGFVDPDDDFALARNDDDHDVLGHGTACADVILGVAPDARIIPVKVFGKMLETSPGTLQKALEWAIESGVQVINVSLGTRLKHALRPLYVACELARRQGIIIVAAGHNGNLRSFPAIFENVIGVSAGRFDSPYAFHYRAREAMECVGWGVDRPVLWVGGERVVRHGTSFAAPGVAGIVSLILERHPGARIEDVRQMLARFALPGGEEPRRKRKRAAAPAASAPTQSASTPRKQATTSDQPAPAKPAAKTRKKATTADQPALAKPATKARKKATTADHPAAAKPATKTRKKATTADHPAAATPAAKTRKRAAAPVADTVVEPAKTPRKRTAAAAKASDTVAPAKARKSAATAPAVADTARSKRAAKPAKASDDATPGKASNPRKQAATPTTSDDAAPAKPASKPRKRATAKRA
jgi:subtilisin